MLQTRQKAGKVFSDASTAFVNPEEPNVTGETINRSKGSGINRRNYLKSAGVAIAGRTMGTGLTLATESAVAAQTASTTITNFRCPICAKDFSTYGELKGHFAAAHPGLALPVTTKLKVNGKDCVVLVEPHWTLQRTLQHKLGLTGARQMCDRGVCGSCSVIMDGRVVRYCTTLAVECEGKIIETVEGIAASKKWDALIQSYCKWDAMQCGYCTPGFVVSAKALMEKNPDPTENDCKQALAQHLLLRHIPPPSYRHHGGGERNERSMKWLI